MSSSRNSTRKIVYNGLKGTIYLDISHMLNYHKKDLEPSIESSINRDGIQPSSVQPNNYVYAL